MVGKQYLLDLTADGYPVIPTVDRLDDLDCLPQANRYAIKPAAGADSIGLMFVAHDELDALDWRGILVSPHRFLLRGFVLLRRRSVPVRSPRPDPGRRWVLEPYESTAADPAFARRIIDWNTLDHGIQRVDACRTELRRCLATLNENLTKARTENLTLRRSLDGARANVERERERNVTQMFCRVTSANSIEPTGILVRVPQLLAASKQHPVAQHVDRCGLAWPTGAANACCGMFRDRVRRLRARAFWSAAVLPPVSPGPCASGRLCCRGRRRPGPNSCPRVGVVAYPGGV